ncbi:MAG: hypothetical protein H7Y59_10500 [Anaerolineales bacterium]|nr:hypothetical protein [Anaerolineales bacterium]
MTKTFNRIEPKMIVLTLATLLFARGLLILFALDSSTAWSNLLGIGGLATSNTQFGALGPIMRIAQLIEGRLWLIVAFPLFFRLSWGRDVTILVAGLGIAIQVFRLFAGSGAFAVVWLVIFVGIAVLFYAEPGIKTYFTQNISSAEM